MAQVCWLPRIAPLWRNEPIVSCLLEMGGSPMVEVLVEAETLSRTFYRGGRPVSALASVSLRVVAGDRIALVGPSGSGKTTLLNLMAGLDRPSVGRISWPALGAADALRPERVGVMFQSRSLVPALTCRENVELPLRLSGRQGIFAEMAMAALARFGVDQIAEL